MTGQHYGTLEVNRGCVKPGMLVMHKNRIWKASANFGGKLYLKTLSEATRTEALTVSILLDGHGNALIN
ncbi:cell division inhibitor protein [Cronobacter sakazakii]|uniref:phage encoded cell division inhibitor protein n=1 Tax=Cronobacter malonaticus TaxID=413503 RepID=UPI0005182658|nr:phage encoded cell division inhibitor protein [Cronobacter malonaticus]ELY4546021.1 cell division inhibitor protein [Cronobacter sakazakii]HDI3034263.1 cell division inhibitor protein [Cronobacter turicensis]EGT4370530.1 cell division inhibitor protein [Cronobacter malonaticus]ELY5803538.1 cell division inhibitor protein [Cronobacter sakazakii]MDI6466662.1 cell division inhibitor protein [Cronobacter malonaticus]